MSWAGPATFPATSLADNLDKKLLVILRDGRKLVGILRSFDQFANVVLEGSIERIVVGDLFCDLPLGLYVIRGENVVLIGELGHLSSAKRDLKLSEDILINYSPFLTLMDPEKDELPSHMVRVSPADIRRAQKAERDATELKGTMRKRMEFLDLD